ncbi:TMV resistance protein N-like [Cryptomeria japonica]|uniref:TMV resistance protein N-like n=1 Tax=Cryptomeria japonica TaxID=3369 RepID=UPI0027DA889F|nr:TMV resistance protein N-like [Cryptomeria japonica]
MENDEHAYNNPKSLFLAAPYYDVFLNHRGADVKKTVASLIFHNLENKGLKVFFDKKSIQVGNSIPQSIEDAIYSASLHIVIMSANYAESTSCLKELNLILKTGAPIIPVFCGVEPSELRMKDKNSVYAPAFQKHKHSGKFEVDTVDEWRKALHEVSYIKGYIFRGDQGELLEQIASSVAELIERRKSQPRQRDKGSTLYMVLCSIEHMAVNYKSELECIFYY